jgi:hypothetical protein
MPPAASTTRKQDEVKLPRPDIRMISVPVTGLSSLICHNWADKAKKMMIDKQTKQATAGRAAKVPEDDFRASLYPHPDGGYGFPASAFKNAMVRAGTYTNDKMTYLRGAFYVVGDMVKIEAEPEPREDMVRVANGAADVRYRGEFPEGWGASLAIQYNATSISAEQIVNLVSVAGFSVGIGDWRPEKDGSHGRFAVTESAAKEES